MKDFGSFLGNSIMIVMGIAIFFGNNADIGYVSMAAIVAIVGTLIYEYKSNAEFRKKFHKK
ncbi:hypothetical protein GGI1_12043 [Acidithiobacillus sp. GGI-221]|nr:hypothetical protein GGI1_12043 [Acidithiobacillus sp. GGI-221]